MWSALWVEPGTGACTAYSFHKSWLHLLPTTHTSGGLWAWLEKVLEFQTSSFKTFFWGPFSGMGAQFNVWVGAGGEVDSTLLSALLVCILHEVISEICSSECH